MRAFAEDSGLYIELAASSAQSDDNSGASDEEDFGEGGEESGDGMAYKLVWCAHDEILGVPFRNLVRHMRRHGIRVRKPAELLKEVGAQEGGSRGGDKRDRESSGEEQKKKKKKKRNKKRRNDSSSDSDSSDSDSSSSDEDSD